MNTNIFLLRAFQLGISMQDLDELNYGDVVDMITEANNDQAKYQLKATQEDIDTFATW